MAQSDLFLSSTLPISTPQDVSVQPPSGSPPADLIPFTTMALLNIQRSFVSSRPLSVLFDSGSTDNWISLSALPQEITPTAGPTYVGSTLAGNFTTSQYIIADQLMLPEFFRNRTIQDVTLHCFPQGSCRYDAILGRSFLSRIGMTLDFDDHSMTWDDQQLVMRPYPSDSSPEILGLDLLLDLYEEDLVRPRDPPSFDAHVTSSDQRKQNLSLNIYHDQIDLRAHCAKLSYLSKTQQEQLLEVLERYPTLWDNELRAFPDYQVHFELKDNAVPFSSRGYPVPYSQRDLFKTELDRLTQIGVLEPCERSEWCAGTFIIGKAKGGVRWLTDFRGLNLWLKRRTYPIPKINEIFERIRGYDHATKLDVSMQFYTFELDDFSKPLTTFATPFGLYRYRRCPQGVTIAPEFAQEVMDAICRDLPTTFCYFDDTIVYNYGTFETHLHHIDVILSRLAAKNFSLNIEKCEFAIQETDFLGYWLTPKGLRPWKRKIDAIQAMQAPKTLKQLKSFIGLVGFYRTMFPKKAHILAPLTDLTAQKFVWLPIHQQAFERMKALVGRDCLLAWCDPTEPFDIETDASDYQLGAVIKQNGRPVAYYSRKLSPAQRNYTTIEKEALSIVATFDEFRTILLGADITVHCDHKNFTYSLSKFTTQRVLRWRINIDEYGATFKHKSGEENIIADALSRVPTTSPDADAFVSFARYWQQTPFHVSSDSHSFVADQVPPSTFSEIDVETLPDMSRVWTHTADSLLVNPVFDEHGRTPTEFGTIHYYQQQDAALLALPQVYPHDYALRDFNGFPLVVKRVDADDFRFVLSDDMLPRLVKWYHELTVHATGAAALENTLSRHFSHPRLSKAIADLTANCEVCKKVKKPAYQYGQLAPRYATAVPWEEVHIDTIGPWSFQGTSKKKRFSFYALTCIDPVTNLLELARHKHLLSKHSPTASMSWNEFHNSWLSRYPKPFRCLHDNGSEFIGHDFQIPLAHAGIQQRSSTVYNPQGNSIIERIHLVVAQVLRVLLSARDARPDTEAQAETIVDRALAITQHATRCVASTALLNQTPGSLAFGRDMQLNLPFIADFLAIRNARQLKIDHRLLRANAHRKPRDFAVNDNIYVRNHTAKSKLDAPWEGPFPIRRVHTNGTVTFERPNGVFDRQNIRHIKPA